MSVRGMGIRGGGKRRLYRRVSGGAAEFAERFGRGMDFTDSEGRAASRRYSVRAHPLHNSQRMGHPQVQLSAELSAGDDGFGRESGDFFAGLAAGFGVGV